MSMEGVTTAISQQWRYYKAAAKRQGIEHVERPDWLTPSHALPPRSREHLALWSDQELMDMAVYLGERRQNADSMTREELFTAIDRLTGGMK